MITLQSSLIPPYLMWQAMTPREKVHAEKSFFTGVSSVAMQYPIPQKYDLYDFIQSKGISLYCAGLGMAIGVGNFAKFAFLHRANLARCLYVANIKGFYAGAALGSLDSIFNRPAPAKPSHLLSEERINTNQSLRI